MGLLSSRLALLDIDDVEAFTRTTIDNYLQQHSAYLNPDDYDDLVAYLVGITWELSERFDPSRSKQSFSTYVIWITRKRVPNWYRSRWPGSRFNRAEAHAVVSLEGLPTNSVERLAAPDPDEREPLGLLVAAIAGDPSADCDPALARLLSEGDRLRARDVALLRDWAGKTASERAQYRYERHQASLTSSA